jgi:hypothetical protein
MHHVQRGSPFRVGRCHSFTHARQFTSLSELFSGP